MKNKTIAKLGVPILLAAALTEAGAMPNLPVFADELVTTQTLEIPIKAMGILDIMILNKRFKRSTPEIIEVAPWLKPEMKSIKISDSDLIEVLRSVGFEGYGLKMAWAIVQEESTSRIYAHNRNRSTGDNSYGLFQINMIDGIGAARLEKYDLDKNEDLFTPLKNAEVAFKISDGGKNWGAWTTYGLAKETVSQFPG